MDLVGEVTLFGGFYSQLLSQGLCHPCYRFAWPTWFLPAYCLVSVSRCSKLSYRLCPMLLKGWLFSCRQLSSEVQTESRRSELIIIQMIDLKLQTLETRNPCQSCAPTFLIKTNTQHVLSVLSHLCVLTSNPNVLSVQPEQKNWPCRSSTFRGYCM